MDPVVLEVISVIQDVFSDDEIESPAEIHPLLVQIKDIYTRLSVGSQTAFADYFEAVQPVYRFETLFYSLMFDLTGRVSYLFRLTKTVGQHQKTLPEFHNFVWQIRSLLFALSDNHLDVSQFVRDEVLRPAYLEYIDSMRQVVEQHVQFNRRSHPGKRKIAIITPQFLGIHHSPSRSVLISLAIYRQIMTWKCRLLSPTPWCISLSTIL